MMRRRTSGSSPALGRAMLAIAFLITLLAPAALPAQKENSKAAAAPFALIAGTVYRPPGLSIAGAEVAIIPDPAVQKTAKLKKSQVVTDSRGEFAVRVPPVPATWHVHVKVSGYRPEQRSVTVEGEQRFDLSIVLEPAHSPKEAQ